MKLSKELERMLDDTVEDETIEETHVAEGPLPIIESTDKWLVSVDTEGDTSINSADQEINFVVDPSDLDALIDKLVWAQDAVAKLSDRTPF
jgi:hypothetical protein